MSVSATRILIQVSNAYRRVLAVFLGVIGPRAAYGLLAIPARVLYRLLDPLRLRSETQCRAALGDTRNAAGIAKVAEQAFVHRAWNLVDLMLADRLIRRSTYHRYGGRIPEPYRGMILDAQRRRQPMVLLTAYYGPFDLLPLFLGFNGVRAAAVYRPHANPDFDAYRGAIRARSGCEMIRDTEAVTRLPQILSGGGTVSILADHLATRRGIPVTFLGGETTVPRTVGLLAAHCEAVVVVAGIRRCGEAFEFEIVVSDLFGPGAWRDNADPVATITLRYVAALEKIILADPAQYLWGYDRRGAAFTRR